jgi:hypothetical protein
VSLHPLDKFLNVPLPGNSRVLLGGYLWKAHALSTVARILVQAWEEIDNFICWLSVADLVDEVIGECAEDIVHEVETEVLAEEQAEDAADTVL